MAYAATNKGIWAYALLSQGDPIKTVKTVIPLNRYSFFEELSDRLLPPLPLLFDIVLEDDSEMIFQNDAIGWRLVVTTMQRWVPRLMLSPEGQKAVNEQFFKPTKWRYLKEMLAPSSSRREVEGMVKLLLPGMQLTQNKKSGWVLYELDRLQLHRFFSPLG